mmetsp:Transcript_60629/g.148740  ORF Transcript_60629/g.148740 Transcript_60629/m.148740 type:complete len:605 (+) Transcript_60629:148-1962(+)
MGMSGYMANNSKNSNNNIPSSLSDSGSTTSTTAAEKAPIDCSQCPASHLDRNIRKKGRRKDKELDNTSSSSNSNTTGGIRQPPFPKSLDKMFVDYATVPRDDFFELFDIGVPKDPVTEGAEDVMILYTSDKSLPWGEGSMANDKFGFNVKDAVANCHMVKVILQEPNKRRKTNQCFAIVPQWESYHIHKFMRLPQNVDSMAKNGRNAPQMIDLQNPLRYVSRSYDDRGRHAGVPVTSRHTIPSYEVLVDYLQNLDRVLTELRVFLKDVIEKANNNNNNGVSTKSKTNNRSKNTIVVLVCNKGQAPLFRNFVCNARAKNLDLSHIVMFATDQETKTMCEELNIAVWYEESIFGGMPETAARSYGDRTFTKMMMAKVYCVHLVLSCGYNVLFQDVDVVWYKNPLPYLDSEELQEFDMIFQDDGARTIRYQPYSPNTGFYYVRNNSVTQFFFSTLLRMGDVIMMTKSHQAALTGLINEFVSWKGLRVKVFRWGDNNPFPGGVEFHRNRQYMKNMLTKKFDTQLEPYIFHMSWTTNKDNKLKFFQQMGEWYTKKEAGLDLSSLEEERACTGTDCCLVKPEITCHYRDKASKIPCNDSPSIDKGRKSFW